MTEQLGFDLGGRAGHERVEVWFDGASRGNGRAGARASIGGIVRDADSGELLAEISEAIGEETNNVAEYRAALATIEAARGFGASSLRVHGDSALVIQQLKGEWKVKAAHLVPLIRQVHEAIRGLQRVEFVHVRRELNREADALANRALDREVDDAGESRASGT
jgi:ribonuclease H / adenosylcobalamin/alpha-ribazole phosphatase